MQIYVAFTKFIMFFLGEWIEWIPILFQMILSHRPIKSLEPRSSPAWRAWDVAPRQEPLAPRLKFLLFYIHMGLFENRIYHIIPNIWMYELNSVIFMGKWSLTIKVWGTLLSNKLMYIYIYTQLYTYIYIHNIQLWHGLLLFSPLQLLGICPLAGPCHGWAP